MPDSDHPVILRPAIDRPAALGENEIHLYVVPVSGLDDELAALSASLNAEERARAARFINPLHGDHYRCIRGMLRKLLATYLSSLPGQIVFGYAQHGKPYLKHEAQLRFNISHSRDMVAYAFSRQHELGVDVEYMRPQKNLDGMIQRIATSREQQELAQLAGQARNEAFYRLWTRKEAYIKMVGRGLGMGLRSIHIGTQASDTPLVVSYKDEIHKGCVVADMSPPDSYKLALCYKEARREWRA